MKANVSIVALSAAIAVSGLMAPRAAHADEAQVIKVNLKEWELGFKTVTVRGEKARFEISNNGTTTHGFELEGKIGGKKFEVAAPPLKPGEKTSLTVALPKGSYEVYCPVDGHEDRGMKGAVRFAGEH